VSRLGHANGAVAIGLVGCGRVAERGYVPALRRTPGVELVAVADRDLSRCRATAPGVPAFADAEALLAGTAVDVLVIATPVANHLADAGAAARAGVRALVEKPPAPTADDAAVLAGLRPEPWVGFNRRFEPRLASLRSEILRHEGGLELELGLAIDRDTWGAYGGSDEVVLDLGPHVVDLVSWLSGRRIERVRAERPRPGALALELALAGGRAHAVIAHDRAWAETVEARDDGRPIGMRFAAGGRTGRALARVGLARFATLADLLSAQLEAVVRHVQQGEPPAPLATAGEAAGVMRVLDLARASLDAGGDWIACSP
jgi:predicted dehydrogenase